MKNVRIKTRYWRLGTCESWSHYTSCPQYCWSSTSNRRSGWKNHDTNLILHDIQNLILQFYLGSLRFWGAKTVDVFTENVASYGCNVKFMYKTCVLLKNHKLRSHGNILGWILIRPVQKFYNYILFNTSYNCTINMLMRELYSHLQSLTVYNIM